ncbi:hypothetical protein COHCIP112018_03459 [Cohnella sp. JJ-181]|nr:hypothetical protein COHCIP112018_03459 [Cohnella sp. JJ-181]
MLILLAGWSAWCGTASAHLNTYGYSDIEVGEGQIRYSLYLDPREVSQWMDMHSSGVFVLGGGASPGPSRPADESPWTQEELAPLLAESLAVGSGGEKLDPTVAQMGMAERAGAPYLRLDLRYALPRGAKDYTVDYRFFYGEDPGHQNYATIRYDGGGSADLIFTKDHHEANGKLDSQGEAADDGSASVQVPAWIVTLWDYTKLGVEHIWTGIDHLLFITALVLARQRRWGYVKVLTAFTVGHSVTIALAALDVFNLSAAFVEPVIALSIAYVAFENIWLKEIRWRWAVALGFGLIHGFGFAQVLRGALGDRYLLTLFSFNLGVEIGQLAVLAVLLPLLLWAARYKSYKQLSVGASLVIGLIGLYWFATRLM